MRRWLPLLAALLLVFISVVAVVAVTSLGAGVYSLFSRASFSF